MPVKFKPSQKTVQRGTKVVTTTHYYIKNTPKQELIDYINSSNGLPKIKQKCKNELDRRGVKLVWEKKSTESII